MRECKGAELVALSTIQFGSGGLADWRPAKTDICLVRCTATGTPGPTLCGIDRFAKDGPGWSVGGGVTGPGVRHTACRDCVQVAVRDFPGIPVTGSVGANAIHAAIGEATA